MPYIHKDERAWFDWREGSRVPMTPGQLNYLITDICRMYLECTEKKYQHYNDIVGALESAKLEFYRRMVVPYEAKKSAENGDVFNP